MRCQRYNDGACSLAARPARRQAGLGQNVSERDSKRIIRQWDREIEDEIRRDTARNAANGPWKAVVWATLWLLWLGLLVLLVAQARRLG